MTEEPTAPLRERVRPWLALLLPPLAWYVFEVGLAAALRLDCEPVGSWLGAAWGAASLLLCGVAVALTVPTALDAGAGTPSPRWLAAVARLGAGVFALAIVFQTAASLIIPPCGR